MRFDLMVLKIDGILYRLISRCISDRLGLESDDKRSDRANDRGNCRYQGNDKRCAHSDSFLRCLGHGPCFSGWILMRIPTLGNCASPIFSPPDVI